MDSVYTLLHSEEAHVNSLGEGATILLIDDDPHLLPILAIMVQTMLHCRVVTATDGVAGLERVAEGIPTSTGTNSCGSCAATRPQRTSRLSS
jgi:hypothetical protein